MIRSCNIANYYRLIIYSNIKIMLCGQTAVAREPTMLLLAFELKSHLVDKLKDSAAGGKTNSRCINGSGWVGSRVSR